MVDDLVAWLRAQLDEDERVVRDGGQEGVWSDDQCQRLFVPNDHGRGDGWVTLRIGPQSVLADIEAKRQILDLHYGHGRDESHANPLEGRCQECGLEAPCLTLRLLASAYRHRHGYRPEWIPQ